jgi:hypothetical protein
VCVWDEDVEEEGLIGFGTAGVCGGGCLLFSSSDARLFRERSIENGWGEDKELPLRKINTPYCSLKVMTRYECHIISSSTIGTPSMRYIYMQQ